MVVKKIFTSHLIQDLIPRIFLKIALKNTVILSQSHSLECHHDFQWQGVIKISAFWIAWINWTETAFGKLRGSYNDCLTNIWYP